MEKSGFRYFATAFGQCVSRLYIDPITGIVLRDGLKNVADGKPLSSVGLLHLICSCPDSELIMSIKKTDYEELEGFASTHSEELIITPEGISSVNDVYAYLTTLKTTWMLSCWIDEEKEEIMCDDFGVGPGDIHRHVESAQWLLHAAEVVAELFGHKKLTFILEDLRNRVNYGIREELLELVSLKGIGRVRARMLFGKGFKRLSDLKFVSVDKLSGIKQIGKTIAKDIIAQVNRHFRRKKTTSIR